MISIVKRILKISGKYQKNVILGLIFSGLKSFFVSLMLLAVLLIMINLEQLNMTIIMQATAIIVVSIFGRFIFQYLCDRKLSASGYEIFKDKRIEIGEKIKESSDGIFFRKKLRDNSSCFNDNYFRLRSYGNACDELYCWWIFSKL